MLNKLNNWQKSEILMQIGQDRLRNICSICHKKMDIKKYTIQMCKKCRKIAFSYMQREILPSEIKRAPWYDLCSGCRDVGMV